MKYQAELIAVGTELLQGGVANTDAQMISEALNAQGISVVFHTVVGDDARHLAEVTEIARKRASLLIYIGGLGPTYDDMTKTVVSQAFARPLQFHADVVDEMHHYYATVFHRPLPDCSLQQAYLPQGCEVFHNPVGTAPGCVFEDDDITVMMVPGVPRECRYMLFHHVMPWLRRRTGEIVLSHEVRTFGLNEPRLQEMLGSVMTEASNPALAPYAKDGEVLVHVTARGRDEAECQSLMKPVLEKVRSILGNYIYTEEYPSLEATVVALLKEKGLTCATAESLTGGLIAKRITDVPGASQVFMGGVVSYTNAVKAGVLGVPQELLDQYSAVSAPVAAAMASGARRITGADIAVSVTGVAGPDRDDRGHEVGTVFLGFATANGVKTREIALGGDREWIRRLTAYHALDSIRRYCAGLN